MVWRIFLGISAGVVLAWLALVAALWRIAPSEGRLQEASRLLPDALRLVARMARDRQASRRVRVMLWLLLTYLVLPFDLVPDFIPVIGYADDVIVLTAALRWIVRRAGGDTLRRNWPGTPEGLSAVERVISVSRE